MDSWEVNAGWERVLNAVQDGIRSVLPAYRGTVHALKSIVIEEGWQSLYNGLSPALFGAGMQSITLPGEGYLLYDSGTKVSHKAWQRFILQIPYLNTLKCCTVTCSKDQDCKGDWIFCFRIVLGVVFHSIQQCKAKMAKMGRRRQFESFASPPCSCWRRSHCESSKFFLLYQAILRLLKWTPSSFHGQLSLVACMDFFFRRFNLVHIEHLLHAWQTAARMCATQAKILEEYIKDLSSLLCPVSSERGYNVGQVCVL